jgi:hypothetical protein
MHHNAIVSIAIEHGLEDVANRARNVAAYELFGNLLDSGHD